ncbi:HigA family addiction module antitoxin [Dyadobacter sp. CY347]|uniref:HigA family addiction module antitoxin n=1 Tax=Dyadobacter sp. CY347 TaxID=2909336 RepID=UPI001F2EC538|nr:HigA family addiction module antitoxin [Dyadobacter sp. CY347]MCF2488893.1 HigA family addiction module antitoxin [Dyadobacter sp. CY347]
MEDNNKVKGPMENPLHPGQVLKQMYLEPLNLTITQAAEGLAVDRKTLSYLVNGKQSVSVNMALRLAEAFNTTPQLWLNMQQNYDLRQAENATKLVKNYTIQHFWEPQKAASQKTV